MKDQPPNSNWILTFYIFRIFLMNSPWPELEVLIASHIVIIFPDVHFIMKDYWMFINCRVCCDVWGSSLTAVNVRHHGCLGLCGRWHALSFFSLYLSCSWLTRRLPCVVSCGAVKCSRTCLSTCWPSAITSTSMPAKKRPRDSVSHP